MKCVFCHKNEARRKYCSVVCIKRAYMLRKKPLTRSYFNDDNKDFWKTETGFGFIWEQYAATFLKATHIPFNNGPDLQHPTLGGIDVKVCRLYRRKKKRGEIVKSEQQGQWIFNGNSKKESVSWFFCICLNENGKDIYKQLMIPAEIFYKRKTGISVGHTSIFDEYII